MALSQALSQLEVSEFGGSALPAEVGLDKLCTLSQDMREAGGRQYLVGNGASAAFSNHMALDWTKNGGVPTHSFSDAAFLTALGNDLGYDEVFSAPLLWYSQSGDVLVTISSSGNSVSILKAIESARAKGLRVVTFSGLRPDNKSRQRGDLNFYIPAYTYGIVECAHQILLHVWLDRFMGIKEWDCTDFQNMNSQEFKL
jgi:D-sedoheptulose 7-phosphate isomerase